MRRVKLSSLVMSTALVASVAQAATVVVPSPGNGNDIQPAIQAAVNSAVSGDTIVLPQGDFVLNNTVNVVGKFLSIQGKGMSRTVLYRSEAVSDSALSGVAMFRFTPNSTATSNIVVSDMTLRSKNPIADGGDMGNGTGGSVADDVGLQFVDTADFTVTGCRFQFFGYGAVLVKHGDSLARGLIYRNQFLRNFKGAVGTGPLIGLGLGYGVVIYGANNSWVSDARFGTDNFIFVEDNTFEYHRHSIAAGGNGLYVFRHNDVRNNRVGPYTHAIDAHEARLTPGGNYYSTRAVEIYANTVVNDTFWNGTPIAPGHSGSELVETAIHIRGGEALIHDNYIRGYRFGTGLSCSIVPAGKPYPVLSQIGYASGETYGASHTGADAAHGSGDVFDWTNDFLPYVSPASSSELYIFNQAYLAASRDYHTVAKPSYATYAYPHPRRSLSEPDLSITKTDGQISVMPGQLVTYTIVAANAGPIAASGASVTDTLPAALTGATWTCVGAGGGTCTASGSGGISDSVNLPAGASVTYTLTATANSANVSNTAAVTAPAGTVDPSLANNTATDVDAVVSLSISDVTVSEGDAGTRNATFTVTLSSASSQAVTVAHAAQNGRASALPNPAVVTDLGWKIVGTADFDGDGDPDLLWQHQGNGALVTWYMNGLTRTGYAILNPGTVTDLGWKIVATADFNLDGQPDILWQHRATSQLAMWFMKGVRRQSFAVLPPGAVAKLGGKRVGPR